MAARGTPAVFEGAKSANVEHPCARGWQGTAHLTCSALQHWMGNKLLPAGAEPSAGNKPVCPYQLQFCTKVSMFLPIFVCLLHCVSFPRPAAWCLGTEPPHGPATLQKNQRAQGKGLCGQVGLRLLRLEPWAVDRLGGVESVCVFALDTEETLLTIQEDAHWVCFWKKGGILLKFPHVAGSGDQVSSPVLARCRWAACPHTWAAVGVLSMFAKRACRDSHAWGC